MSNISFLPSVSVIIINWNGNAFLKDCILSLNQQTYTNFELLFIDNASTDNSLALIQKLSSKNSIIKNEVNMGYSFAANQGIERTKGEFVLIMNSDVILTETYIENTIKQASQYEDAGSFGGKLLRFPEIELKNNIIDSTGLVLFNDIRRPQDRGMLEEDLEKYNEVEYVFGINGAAVCYRRKMLDDIKVCGEYFDSDFFCYFEDVDLAWRSVLFGWKSLYVPFAVAYHYRGGSSSEKKVKTRIYSSRNRYLIYLKNEPVITFLKYLPLIFTVEFLRLLKYTIKEPVSILGFIFFIIQIPLFFKKRQQIQKKRKISTGELEKWYFYKNK